MEYQDGSRRDLFDLFCTTDFGSCFSYVVEIYEGTRFVGLGGGLGRGMGVGN